MAEIRVVIVDDHSIVRQGLRALLDREPDITVIGEAASASAAMLMLAKNQPDVVLLDLKLSAANEWDGLNTCARIADRFPASKVLVLTTFADDWLILQAIRQGAKGYVVKDVDLTDLVRAIRAVHHDGSAFDSRSANVVVRWLHGSRDPVAETSNITGREREVLALLAQGLSNAAIGQKLFISSATVKFHVANAMHKLGAKRRAEVVYVASKLGVI
jgi:DNA-binding NarL/FixJ family response regulator